ncbi:hypothetical protein SRHO_G00220090 [Serrasalmus rhombeus]
MYGSVIYADLVQAECDPEPGDNKEPECICLPCYNRESSWELYSVQLQVVIQYHGWMAAVTVIQMCLALEEKVLQVFIDLPVELHDDLAVLTTALQQSFRQMLAALSVRRLFLVKRRLSWRSCGTTRVRRRP